jgi:outer membrane protein OmpA-like peptidoglycan-associated protein
MKHPIWLSLALTTVLMVPAVAQQNNSANNAQNPPAATQPGQQPQTSAADQPAGAHEPLTMERHEGFWGKLNPFARKKYVQRQMQPVRDRVNELDELTAANAKNIRDVDARAQEGIRLAHAKATEADQHAIEAGNRAQQANQLVTQANTRLNTVEQVVGNIDQYQPVTQADIHFRPGQTVLSKKAKEALDQIADSVKGQKGYIVEVQGFSSGKGQMAIENSQRLAQSVVRYLALNHDIPIYRIYLLGMGNAPVPASTQTATKARRSTSGGRVEVSLLKNNVEQLAATSTGMAGAEPRSGMNTQGGMSGAASSQPSQPAAQPSSSMSNTQQPSSNANPAASQPQATQQ